MQAAQRASDNFSSRVSASRLDCACIHAYAQAKVEHLHFDAPMMHNAYKLAKLVGEDRVFQRERLAAPQRDALRGAEAMQLLPATLRTKQSVYC